jgi:hypothetical protein
MMNGEMPCYIEIGFAGSREFRDFPFPHRKDARARALQATHVVSRSAAAEHRKRTLDVSSDFASLRFQEGKT